MFWTHNFAHKPKSVNESLQQSQLIPSPYHGMCLDRQEFVYCYPYCLSQTVETDRALNQESQEVVK